LLWAPVFQTSVMALTTLWAPSLKNGVSTKMGKHFERKVQRWEKRWWVI